MALIDECDAALALPGGVGTLNEIAAMWSHLLTRSIPPKPLVLIGPGWRSVVQQFYVALGSYVPAEQRTWLYCAQDVREAVEKIKK